MRFPAFAPRSPAPSGAGRSLFQVGSVFKLTAFFFLIFFSLFLFFQTPTFAQAQNYIPQNTNQNVPNNLNTYTQSVLFSVMSAVGCQLAGIDPANPKQQCLEIDPNTGKLGFMQNNGGLIGFMGNIIGALYTPPIHTGDYFRYLAGNFGIAKGAYAQGVGLTSINPISGLWVIFRNVVYLLFVLIFILIGLGIMLRVRIDPRTVMTVQNQIPKIIIGLILVTFSFAIAGFLIDLMWIMIIMFINILTAAHPIVLKNSNYVTTFGLSDVVGGFFGVAFGTAQTIGGGIYNTFNANTLPGAITLPTAPGCGLFDIGCYVGEFFAATIGGLVNQVLGIVLGFIVGSFVFLIVIIAVLWALFRLWFALLGAYISILIDIIFAPFWIVGGMIPGAGQGIGFGAWIRDLAANLMAFPVVIGLFLIGRVLADGFTTASGSFFTPPLLGNPQGSFGAIIAFGIIMMSPNVVKMTKAAFKSSSMDTRSIEQGVGLGQVVATAGTSRLWRGMTKAPDASRGITAGPFRQFGAFALTTRPTNIFRGQRVWGTTKLSTIDERVTNIQPGITNLGGRLSRDKLAQSLVGKPAPKADRPGSNESGGAQG